MMAPNKDAPAFCCQASSLNMVSAWSSGGTQSIGSQLSGHPLDPLNAREVAAAVQIMRSAISIPAEAHEDITRIYEVVLQEPGKEIVAIADGLHQQSSILRINGADGSSNRLNIPKRRVRLISYNRHRNETSVWIVELSEVHAGADGVHGRGQVVSRQVIEHVQPPMDAMEYVNCEAAVKAYPPFIDAMKKRGVQDMSLVMVDPWCTGYYGEEHAPNKRLARPLIFCRASHDTPLDNGYGCPVEGIRILVDLGNLEIVKFSDQEFVPLPPLDPYRNYTPGSTRGGVDRIGVKPLLISQPEGPSFTVSGHAVEWQKWRFRVGFTPREGLVLHTVGYHDDEKGLRSVAHRLSFVEMVVPYGDPNDPHYQKNAFDAGEDGLGKNAHSLKLGCDCLGLITYFDAYLADFHGKAQKIENCICMHEEDYGVLWKHMDWRSGLTEVRRSRRLVVSFFCTVANYEYGFFWYFYQDGKIEAEVKLTGILSLGAVKPGERRKYGAMINKGLYAPIHQHFFVARMDMAVDCKPGDASNQVLEVNVKTEEPGKHNPHNNAFYAEETLLRSEAVAKRDCDSLAARHWVVRNTRKTNRSGTPVGYKLVPGSNCLPFAKPNAMFLRRAAFLKHNLWVTAFDPSEKFPGGEFPNQNPRIGEGLPTWVKQDRNLEEADVVLWYVFGITHMPRLEDWPVMPVEYIGFSLMPCGFFDYSPAIDVPPSIPSVTQPAKAPDATSRLSAHGPPNAISAKL